MEQTAKYPKNTIGNSLATKIPVAPPNATIKQIKNLINNNSRDYTTINYIYIVNEHQHLKGILSIKTIFETNEAELAKNVMVTNIVTAHPYTHQEKAAQLALKHNIKAIPIIDKENKFLGVITSDKILSIMHQEKVEDLLKFAGISGGHGSNQQADDIMSLSFLQSLKHRLPWIIIGLVGGILIAQTIGFFEHTLEQNIILASFIPLMVYMSNAVGQQVNAFVIRDSAINTNIPFKKYFFKQFWVVFLISILVGITLYAYTFIAHGDIIIAKIMGIGIFGTVISSIFSGFFIPFLFIRLKSDPANASGPISTVIQDFLSILIYFLVATAFLG